MIRPVRLRLLIISLLLCRREEGLTGRTNRNRLCKLGSIPLALPLVCIQTLLSQHQTKTTTISWAVQQTHPDRSCFGYDIMAASERLSPGECVQNAYGPKSAVGETFSWILLSFQ